MKTKVPHCQICDQEGHYPAFCYKKKQRPTIKTRRLKQNGKHHRLWQNTKRKWFKQNERDYYSCYICYKTISRNEVTLDHIKSRTRAPELRYELTNLAPCCWACNNEKGSRSIEEM